MWINCKNNEEENQERNESKILQNYITNKTPINVFSYTIHAQTDC
jgi:hypothetical protein